MHDPADPFAALHESVAVLRSRQLFFIGGAPKSGTTWLQLLLDAHPEIACRGEGHFANQLEPALFGALTQYSARIGNKNAALFRDVGGYPKLSRQHMDYLLATAIALLMAEGAGAAPIVGEKTPDNIFVLPRLRALFPTARFVLILRDGRDCATSGWFHNLRLSESATYAKFPTFSHYVRVYAKAWAKTVETGLHFAATDRGCTLVRYDSLLRTPEPTLAELLAFLGAKHDPATLRHCLDAADFTRLAGGRQPGQEDRSSLFRIGISGDWQRHFTPEDCTAFDTLAGAALRRCGF